MISIIDQLNNYRTSNKEIFSSQFYKNINKIDYDDISIDCLGISPNIIPQYIKKTNIVILSVKIWPTYLKRS